MSRNSLASKHRLTQRQKEANDFQWYKDQVDLLDRGSVANSGIMGYGGVSDYKRMKANYDLFNNIINVRDFEYVTQPFGADAGELPANFENRDIVSGKIKVLLGMEMKMPFDWHVFAVNEEATTRKEEEEFGRIQDFVVSSVMQPIKLAAAKEAKAKQKGAPLSSEEQMQIQQQIDQEVESKTPDKVRKYMQREHQDPAEMLGEQLLEFLIPAKKIKHKFNKGWKHSTLSGKQIYWIGEINGEPDIEVVNPLFFEYDTSDDNDFIEDSEWAKNEMWWTPSKIISKFGSKLTDEQKDKIMDENGDAHSIHDADFTFDESSNNSVNTKRIVHFNWKALQLVQFLTYTDTDGNPQQMLVDENYKLNADQGDIKLEREWIPQSHECYKIMSDIYVYCRPVPGQDKDLDNLYECNLSYYGAVWDNLNSPVTAPMDRLKSYQFFYDIIIYRMELLMASDEGKMFAANINAVPKSAGLDVEKLSYFMKANKILWLNPNEEGNRSGDITNMVKEIDMSLVSDIDKYWKLAEGIKQAAGASIGVTPQMEAQIAAGDAVTNTQQNLVQASYIIQPYFELHNTVKSNVLNGYLNVAKTTYAKTKPKKLTYVLDDMSIKTLTVDVGLLENSRLGIFVANSTQAADAKRAVEQLSQAAMQNQQIDLGDVIRVIKSNSINEAQELLEVAQEKKQLQMQAAEQGKIQDAQAARAAQADIVQKAHENKMEEIKLKEELTTEREIKKQAILSLGFDTNKDEDNNGNPDVLDIAGFNLDSATKNRKLDLEQRRQDFVEKDAADKNKLAKEKLAIDRKKADKPLARA